MLLNNNNFANNNINNTILLNNQQLLKMHLPKNKNHIYMQNGCLNDVNVVLFFSNFDVNNNKKIKIKEKSSTMFPLQFYLANSIHQHVYTHYFVAHPFYILYILFLSPNETIQCCRYVSFFLFRFHMSNLVIHQFFRFEIRNLPMVEYISWRWIDGALLLSYLYCFRMPKKPIYMFFLIQWKAACTNDIAIFEGECSNQEAAW